MTTLVSVKPWDQKPETGFVKLDDGRDAWTPAIKQLTDLVGKELPEGWLLREGPKGWQLLPPQEGKGKKPYTPKWSDTEAGFYISDERIDRRRAAELATYEGQFSLTAAQSIYAFLRQTASPSRPATEVKENAGELSSEGGSPAPTSAVGDHQPSGGSRGPAAGTTSGSGDGEAPGPATVEGEADRPGGTASPSANRKWADDAWDGMEVVG